MADQSPEAAGEAEAEQFEFAAKFMAYERELRSLLVGGGGAERDVVVLMDAFDVLVFPSLKKIKQVCVCVCVCV